MIDWRELIILRTMRLMKKLRLDQFLVTGKSHPFTAYFKSFERVEAVKRIFGEQTETVLHNLRVVFTRMGGYMWVNPANGQLVISSQYLNTGNKIDIYLDIIHELVHVKQWMEGTELFEKSYKYVERPTEIEAYRHVVEEARSLGLSDKRICEHLKTEWMSDDDFKRLAKTLKVKC